MLPIPRTFGWKKERDAISLSQITDGIVRRDGTRLDSGAGGSRETAASALRSLERKGLIIREPPVRPDGGMGVAVYRIRFRRESADPPPGSEDPTPRLGEPTLPVGPGDSVLVKQADPQDHLPQQPLAAAS